MALKLVDTPYRRLTPTSVARSGVAI